MQNRRSFLTKSGLAAGAAILSRSISSAAPSRTYKAAIIGRTGGGDYGHGLDTIFKGLDNVTVAAVADENEAGLKNAQQRSGAQRTYRDYREMLQKEKPDLVSIASRQPDCHRDMALAALETGAHLYIEKPITETLREADEIVNAAQAKGLKIGVAHVKRYMDDFLLMRKLIAEGYFGDILDVRFQGKQDTRAGAEDLFVLGVHDMDMMRYLLGDPLWCFATVMIEGRDITREGVHQGQEPYTVAGDTIHADFQFHKNIQCRWSSVKAGQDWNKNYSHNGKSLTKWGFDLFGTQRILSYQESVGAFILDAPFLALNDPQPAWRPLATAGKIDKPESLTHPIRDLIHAIEADAKPLCSGEDARWAVEMVSAVFQSQKAKARVAFPLQNREHPLKNW